jgi:hypothetical protein
VDTSTGSGDIRVGRVDESVKARSGSGEIIVDGAASIEASTGSGNVVASSVRGDLEARSGSGDITVGQKGKGHVDVSTGSGDVEVTGAAGPVHVRASSGDILVEGTPASDWEVSIRRRTPADGRTERLRSRSAQQLGAHRDVAPDHGDRLAVTPRAQRAGARRRTARARHHVVGRHLDPIACASQSFPRFTTRAEVVCTRHGRR